MMTPLRFFAIVLLITLCAFAGIINAKDDRVAVGGVPNEAASSGLRVRRGGYNGGGGNGGGGNGGGYYPGGKK
ncbi:hypothetical protein GPALN_003370 [Globodera pallida]|nr:hypothetical protein GPALN_003370 [Globodera pallida]